MKFARYKHDSELSYAEGATLVFELLKTKPEIITQIFLRPAEKYGDDITKILQLAKDKNITIVETNKPFNVLATKNACLLIAEFKKFTNQLNPNANHLLLVNPSDAGNLGTIMRTAAAFNIQNIGIIPPAVDHFDPKVIRASMGAAFHLNLEIFNDFASYCAAHPNHNRYAFMLNNQAMTIQEAIKTKAEPFTLIMGNEASGLPKSYETDCQAIYIPQSDAVDSLNLSIATAIALYEFTK
jgi:TrmH family RNA methyltransferase